MSVMRPILNLWLRLTEKPFLTRTNSPQVLRRTFETKARLFFHGPRSVIHQTGVLAGLPTIWLRPRSRTPAGTILFLHGGGYVFGSPRTHRVMLSVLVRNCGWSACLPQYRKAPEHPFPAAIEDAVEAYKALLEKGETRIVLGGDSAGGGLALALLAQIIALGLPLPMGCFAMSPLTDLSASGASRTANAQSEVILPAIRLDEMCDAVLNGAEPKDPRISPLFAAFTGACPVWLTAGDTEILLDDARKMAAALRDQGVPVTEVIEHDLPHVWPLFHNLLPEARATLRTIAAWVNSLPPPPADS